jgi:hypothetical protein
MEAFFLKQLYVWPDRMVLCITNTILISTIQHQFNYIYIGRYIVDLAEGTQWFVIMLKDLVLQYANGVGSNLLGWIFKRLCKTHDTRILSPIRVFNANLSQFDVRLFYICFVTCWNVSY